MFDFLKIGSDIKKLGKELTDVRAEIESVTREIEDVSFAPTHPDDILAGARKLVLRREEEYRQLFKDRIFARFAGNPKSLADGSFWNDSHLMSFSMGGSETAFCGLIGTERIMAMFKRETDAMDPSQYGPPIADRGATLQVLKDRLRTLQANEKRLIEGAESVGLAIQ